MYHIHDGSIHWAAMNVYAEASEAKSWSQHTPFWRPPFPWSSSVNCGCKVKGKITWQMRMPSGSSDSVPRSEMLLAPCGEPGSIVSSRNSLQWRYCFGYSIWLIDWLFMRAVCNLVVVAAVWILLTNSLRKFPSRWTATRCANLKWPRRWGQMRKTWPLNWHDLKCWACVDKRPTKLCERRLNCVSVVRPLKKWSNHRPSNSLNDTLVIYRSVIQISNRWWLTSHDFSLDSSNFWIA